MSGYMKVPDCDCDKRKVIIIEKDKDYYEEYYECTSCESQRPKQRGVILACGKQNMDIVIDILNPPISATLPIEIVSVALDTTLQCCPLVLLNFCCTISVPQLNLGQTADFVNYTITLFKECDDIPKQQLAVYTFTRTAPFDISSDSFCFKFCDFNNTCVGCCFYTIELTRVQTDTTNFSTGDSTISRATVTAKSQRVYDDEF
ncbi:DUF4489 domain-containing protein [Wukongibacter baidiensis]|uniref:DUF4489 domain-containing protein n=1 Tax=Wukongibacter baidiensis TaxID=1723361 RepID=UPI003D7F7527